MLVRLILVFEDRKALVIVKVNVSFFSTNFSLKINYKIFEIKFRSKSANVLVLYQTKDSFDI